MSRSSPSATPCRPSRRRRAPASAARGSRSSPRPVRPSPRSPGGARATRAAQALVAEVDRLVVLDRLHLDPDPEGRSEHRIQLEPEVFAAVAWDAHATERPAAPDGWLEAWTRGDLVARAAIDRTLD